MFTLAQRGVGAEVHGGGAQHGDHHIIGDGAPVQGGGDTVCAGGADGDGGRGGTRAPEVGGTGGGGVQHGAFPGTEHLVVAQIEDRHRVHLHQDGIGDAAASLEDLHAVGAGGPHADRGRGGPGAPQVGGPGDGGIKHALFTLAQRGVGAEVHGSRGGIVHRDGIRDRTIRRISDRYGEGAGLVNQQRLGR